MDDTPLLPLVFDVHAHHPDSWGRLATHRFVAAGFSPSSNADLLSVIPSCPNGWMALGLGPQEIQRTEPRRGAPPPSRFAGPPDPPPAGYHDDYYPDLDAAISQVEKQARAARADPALSKKLVAIGEVGLDHHWGKTTEERERQFVAFERMISLAQALSLPLVIHSRDAERECVQQLLAAQHLHAAGGPPPAAAHYAPEPNPSGAHAIGPASGGPRVLMHCFGGKLEQAKQCAEAGWLISVPPQPNSERKKIIKALPLSSLVVESDAPYVGAESGEGALQSAEMIARYKEMKLEEVLGATAENARQFFWI